VGYHMEGYLFALGHAVVGCGFPTGRGRLVGFQVLHLERGAVHFIINNYCDVNSLT